MDKVNLIRLADRWHKFPHEVLEVMGYPARFCVPALWHIALAAEVASADAAVRKFHTQKAAQKRELARLRRSGVR